jgi:hypothetical protein
LGTAARETNASRAAVPIISQSGDEAGSMQIGSCFFRVIRKSLFPLAACG